MHPEEREMLHQMGADFFRNQFPDGESDLAAQDWTHSESGKLLDARFMWKFGEWLFLTHFNGQELDAIKLFDTHPPFKGWKTAKVRELHDYVISVSKYIKFACTDEFGIPEDILYRISDSSDSPTSEEADPTKQALEVVRNMTVETWKQDRGRLYKILSESANAARPGVE